MKVRFGVVFLALSHM